MQSISENDYVDRLDAVKRNFELAKKYCMIESNLWENCLKNLV